MGTLKEWRGFDIASRCAKIEKAINHTPLRNPDDFPIVINAPCYFGFGDKCRGAGYWHDPAYMVGFQERGFERHLSEVDDDTVPYFMPWFGTGVLASAFGCGYREAAGDGDDPAVTSGCIETVHDIAKLKLPDPYKDGWMPRVLKFIDYAAEHSDLPVGLTDMNSPLCTSAQMAGYENLFCWMYEEPNAVHELIAIVCEAFTNWVKVQKKHTGEPPDQGNGLQGVWAPKGMGVWMSDDDNVSISGELFAEFVAPAYKRVFAEFGAGSDHFCGNGYQHADTFLAMGNVCVVNNSIMGNMDKFGVMARKLHGRVALQIQALAEHMQPPGARAHIRDIFSQVDDLAGIMIATFVQEDSVPGPHGPELPKDSLSLKTARDMVKIIREEVAAKERF